MGDWGRQKRRGRGGGADGGGAAGERAGCLGPGGTRDSKRKPRNGTGEEWI